MKLWIQMGEVVGERPLQELSDALMRHRVIDLMWQGRIIDCRDARSQARSGAETEEP